MTTSAELKAIAPELIKKYNQRSDLKGLWQNINTLVPYFALFYLAITSLQQQSYLLSLIYTLLLSLFIVRIFMLMHDCGHRSLFKTQIFNTLCGFFTGVFVGMPQYVWSQHHNFHHSTNGNWEKYRGPLNVMTVEEFKNLSAKKQNAYIRARRIIMAPIGAFMYFIFHPRFNWIRGSLQFVVKLYRARQQQPGKTFAELAKEIETPYWKDKKEYLHMSLNNIVLLSIWYIASQHFGAAAFFTIYIISLSLGGAMGLIIFIIQHNFKDSYASDTEHWDYYQAALSGTSFLTFPKVINWFGADIAYHHIHHLSASIPNYNLAACHREYAHLFDDVFRIRLRDVASSFKYILWDQQQQKIISIDEFRSMEQA